MHTLMYAHVHMNYSYVCVYVHSSMHAQAGFAFLTQTREERFFINIRKRLDHAVAIDTERYAV